MKWFGLSLLLALGGVLLMPDGALWRTVGAMLCCGYSMAAWDKAVDTLRGRTTAPVAGKPKVTP
jgi:hypothetical protein